MKFVESFTDERFKGYCLYCGRASATREHVPPKFFLDDPLPENVQVVEACIECNQGYSKDEQFVGCLLNVLSVGDLADLKILRPKVAATLARSSSLLANISDLLRSDHSEDEWSTAWPRIERVLAKIATGHAVYELGETPTFVQISSVSMGSLDSLSEEARTIFEHTGGDEPFFSEAGSRALTRQLNGVQGWIDVQPGNYRYRVIQHGSGAIVRIVLLGHIGCQVVLEEPE